jgi:type IV pilus assembly protein PilV
MVEVMVSMAVLSVGLLGLAGLQAAGARANYNAFLHSQAAMISQDMFERIRGNTAGNYVMGMGTVLPVGASDCLGTGQNCDADSLARYDLVFLKCTTGAIAVDACVNRGIGAQLPGGDASIAVAGNVYTLTIQWFDSAENLNKSFVFNATI